MLDFSFLDPPIEVAASGPRLEMILSCLRAHGMRAYPASNPIDLEATEPLLVDMESLPAGLRNCGINLSQAETRRALVLLTADTRLSDRIDALIITRDSDLVQLRARLASLVRRQARTAEFRIRLETAASFGFDRAPAPSARTSEVLYLGDGGIGFLSLKAALNAHAISVAAALTLHTAGDYLKSGRFAALLVDLTQGGGDAAGFIDWSRAETVLSSVPLFALTEPGVDLTQRHLAALALSTDLIEYSEDADALAGRISKVIRDHAVSAPLLPVQLQASPSVDPDTGLFHREFLKSHLDRQIAMSSERGEPLSLLTIKLDEESAHALAELAMLVRARVRDTDCVAYYGGGTIALSAPLTPFRGAIRLTERLMETISRHPALNSVRLSWRVVEKRSYHTAGTLLAEGLSGPYVRENAA